MQLEIIKNGVMECDKGFVTLGRNMGTPIKIPVYCFLVKHEKGNVLIDTGFSKQFETTWGKRLTAFKPILETDIPEYLKDIKIDYIINTHLHLDHADNNEKFPDATIICQKDEYELAKNPPQYQKFAYADKFPEGNYQLIEGNYDLFGDCKIHIIKTPGHTKGHQSVLLDLGDKKIFIAGDACYTKENLKYSCLPGFFWNADEVMKQYEYIKNLDAEIIFGHGRIENSNE
jgi:glyoxylase-like metal-dependent hydrolase (beta-lactamase superfamily II)